LLTNDVARFHPAGFLSYAFVRGLKSKRVITPILGMLNNIVLLTEAALRLVERYFAFYGCAAHVAGGEAEGALGAGAVPAQECHVPFPLHADTAQELVLQVLNNLYHNIR
jgi:hypothetical protein